MKKLSVKFTKAELIRIQGKLSICLALVERLAFTLQRGYTLFQLRLFKQVGIA